MVLSNVVNLCWPRLVQSWVTVHGFESLLYRFATTYVNSAWPSLWDRQYEYQRKLGSKPAGHLMHFFSVSVLSQCMLTSD